MISSYKAGGFSLTFENGVTIRVLFGVGDKGSNQHSTVERTTHRKEIIEAYTAEIYIYNDGGAWYTFENGNDDIGYVGAEGVADWIAAVKEATCLADIKEPQTEY